MEGTKDKQTNLVSTDTKSVEEYLVTIDLHVPGKDSPSIEDIISYYGINTVKDSFLDYQDQEVERKQQDSLPPETMTQNSQDSTDKRKDTKEKKKAVEKFKTFTIKRSRRGIKKLIFRDKTYFQLSKHTDIYPLQSSKK